MAGPVHSAAIFSVEKSESGTYQVTQLELENDLPESVNDDRIKIDINIFTIRVAGYLVKSTHEIGVEIYVFTNKLGNFFGNVRDNLVIEGNTYLWRGNIKFYVKNGHELWIEYDIASPYMNKSEGNKQILHF
ncbi:conserved hypothetical protein [Paecilomyces variotii No. 5]|uniref:Uncharacterized protein n=1 Tax=Byssochlamys spectabilis (strain No. 5 / NBRC 109023) TaxID=1356009 RepID=V5G117_BYSSN|nr:conserved hypothetical protein [Paecilomyces variotii No. 5]